MGFKDFINESSLSRLYQHMTKHDVGTITAFRSARDCNSGEPYTKAENKARNKSLLAKLQAKRYSVTSVKGSYIEDYGTPNAKEVGESVFFVVDINDNGNLERDLRKLGEEFEQDSILFIPKSGEKAILIGTNKCKDGYPGYGKKINFDKRGLGKEGEFMTKIKGKPFIFENKIIEEHILPQGFYGRLGCSNTAKQNWDYFIDEETLNESSLSRVLSHNELHDSGALTAFRKAPNCGSGEPYTKAENKARNKSLLAKLQTKGYGVTTLRGIYPEGGKQQKEISYFVVDLNDSGNLETDLRKLGEEFDQDSILFMPKGSVKNEAKAYLIGTNKCKNNWLGYGKKDIFDSAKLGKKSEIYTSFVNGKPFIFEEFVEYNHSPASGYGNWSLYRASKKNWKDFVQD